MKSEYFDDVTKNIDKILGRHYDEQDGLRSRIINYIFNKYDYGFFDLPTFRYSKSQKQIINDLVRKEIEDHKKVIDILDREYNDENHYDEDELHTLLCKKIELLRITGILSRLKL